MIKIKISVEDDFDDFESLSKILMDGKYKWSAGFEIEPSDFISMSLEIITIYHNHVIGAIGDPYLECPTISVAEFIRDHQKYVSNLKNYFNLEDIV